MALLTQTLMDAIASRVEALLPARWEVVTYRSRTTPSATPVDHGGVSMQWEQYSDHAIAMLGLTSSERPTVLREDRRLRVATAAVTWTPTLADEVVRGDGTHWRVLSISGGPGYPFYQLQGRRIS